MIKTWLQRLANPSAPTAAEIRAAMEAQIDDLRATLSAAATVTGRMMAEYAEIRDKLATARAQERERCAKVCERVYGGVSIKFASENSDTYRVQDQTIASCAKAIRNLPDE